MQQTWIDSLRDIHPMTVELLQQRLQLDIYHAPARRTTSAPRHRKTSQ